MRISLQLNPQYKSDTAFKIDIRFVDKRRKLKWTREYSKSQYTLLGIFFKGNKTAFRTKLSYEKGYGTVKIKMKAIIRFICLFAFSCPFLWTTLVWTEFNRHSYILTRAFTRIKTLNPLENSNFMSRSMTWTALDEEDDRWRGRVKKRSGSKEHRDQKKQTKKFNTQSSSYCKIQVWGPPTDAFATQMLSESPSKPLSSYY